MVVGADQTIHGWARMHVDSMAVYYMLGASLWFLLHEPLYCYSTTVLFKIKIPRMPYDTVAGTHDC